MSHNNLLTKQIAENFMQAPLSGHTNGRYLSDFTSIEDAAAEILAEYRGDLDLDRLTTLSDAAAEALAQHKGNLSINRVTTFGDSQPYIALACKMVQGSREWRWLHLNGLKSLSNSIAEALAQHEGNLSLNGLTHLSDSVASALARQRGNLYLAGLICLSDAAAKALANHRGTIEVSSATSLGEAVEEHFKTVPKDAPSQYQNGVLTLPPPARPVKGPGHHRVPWNILISYSKEIRVFKPTSSHLQKWFYQLLPESHKTSQKDYYVSPEAWEVFMDNLDFWLGEIAQFLNTKLKVKQEKITEERQKRKEIQKTLEPLKQKATQAANEAGVQLSKAKKLIDSKTPQGFVTALEIVRTLELDNEATWISLLSEARIKKLVKMEDGTIMNLLLEISGTGTIIRNIIYNSISDKPQSESSTLYLDSMVAISESAAHALAQYPGDVRLKSLTTLSDSAAEALAKHKGDLSLDGLTSLSDAAAVALRKHEGSLSLSGLTTLSDAVAHTLAQFKDKNLDLYRLASLSDTAAQTLAQFKGENLDLPGLTSLSDAATQALAQFKGERLFLNGLSSLSDAIAPVFAHFQVQSLFLDGLTSLSDAAARALTQYKGFLSLCALKRLSNDAVQALAQFEGELRLTGCDPKWIKCDVLERITAAQAQLAQGTPRRFESSEGGSSKFWETELRGSELATRFGRIGTTGQEKIKKFDDSISAFREQAKLIKEKTGKGYSKV